MIKTSQSDDIQDFLHFLIQMFDPDVVRNRIGAAPVDIERFIALARLPLPLLYLGYLREFGENDGVVNMADDANPRLKALIEFYLEQNGKPNSEIPKHGVVTGVYGLSGERTLLYSEAAELGKEEPSVVVSWWGDVDNTLAQTFRNHLYRQAFVNGRQRRGAVFILYQNDLGLFPDAKHVATELGFESYWFSDNWQACLERAEGEALYIVRGRDLTTVYGCFADEKTRDHLKTGFIQQLGLKDGTPAH